ncbi:MAG: SxtJ family membrane protein [Bacteroidota bacterium]|nr:SxtJ family membrane protein [Bacteroidota bacterium]
MSGIKKNIPKSRSFGLLIGLLCFCISTYIYLHTHTFNRWVPAIGIIFIISGLFIPRLIDPFRKFLEYVGNRMGLVNTYFLLTVIYLVLFIPLNLIFRLSGKDSLKLKKDDRITSYWIERPEQDEGNMKNQY